MSRRARLIRAMARYVARAHRAECTPDGWHPLGPCDRWREARWMLSWWGSPPGAWYPLRTRPVRWWRWRWTIRHGRRERGV